MIKYMGGTLSCDIVFGLFMLAWFVTRHILFILVIVSIYVDVPNYSSYKWDPQNGYYATNNVYSGFLVLMGLLQVRLAPLLCHFRDLTSCFTSVPSADLVLNDFEGRVSSINWTRS